MDAYDAAWTSTLTAERNRLRGRLDLIERRLRDRLQEVETMIGDYQRRGHLLFRVELEVLEAEWRRLRYFLGEEEP